MLSAGLRRLSGVCVLCFVAVGCSGADMSNPEDHTLAVSAPAAGAAGRAVQAAGAPSVATAPTAGRGVMPTAPMGGAGTAAAGSGGAPQAAAAAGSGSAGQAAMAAAGRGSQAGSGGAGAGAAAGSGAMAASNPCPLPFSVHQVDDGVSVNGAGCKQMWEGIVMTKGGRGLCSAAFITGQHLISASHCYANDGAVSLDVSAPTWEGGKAHTFQAQVKRSGSDMSLDISIIDLGKPVDWATPERRFVLHAGKVPDSVEMHLYGYGDADSSGGAGTLRAVPKNATIKVSPMGTGTLSGKAGAARLCSGDSGGPAFVEKTAPILYAINEAIVPAGFGGGFGSCAGEDWTIMFTSVSEYMSFIEKSLGTTCERKKVDDLDVAQCWM